MAVSLSFEPSTRPIYFCQRCNGAPSPVIWTALTLQHTSPETQTRITSAFGQFQLDPSIAGIGFRSPFIRNRLEFAESRRSKAARFDPVGVD